MPFPLGKILMAYRPLYLRGLLMDGQYRVPAQPAPMPAPAKPASTEVPTTRAATTLLNKPLQGTTR
ncbi:hypothetical protein [Dyella sp. ASV21]|uniref:hypothetical protein n=1 Tax=Dyella sp. ASV21 TaxID=2795114 RepID=UPI0018EDFB46|nr:hypothetical protein [Dyella sp. ASV21]